MTVVCESRAQVCIIAPVGLLSLLNLNHSREMLPLLLLLLPYATPGPLHTTDVPLRGALAFFSYWVRMQTGPCADPLHLLRQTGSSCWHEWTGFSIMQEELRGELLPVSEDHYLSNCPVYVGLEAACQEYRERRGVFVFKWMHWCVAVFTILLCCKRNDLNNQEKY